MMDIELGGRPTDRPTDNGVVVPSSCLYMAAADNGMVMYLQ